MSAAARRPSEPQPTHGDLADMMHRLEGCLTKLVGSFGEMQTDIGHVKNDINETKLKVASIEGWQAGIATRVGVKEDVEAKPAFWFSFNRVKTIAAAVGIIVALPTLWVVVSTLAQVIGQTLAGLAN